VLFAIRAHAGFEIKAVEPYRAQAAAAASYEPGSVDGTRPGTVYINTHDLPSRPTYLMEAIYLHEAVPGHHFQMSIAQEDERLPRFRRFARDTAYVEGWGVYAETLGTELGLYGDPYSRFGALTLQAWHAARLVVDTGLHARGWSRQRAIDYLRANTSLGDTEIVADVDRYIAMPGQALADKIGQLEFSANQASCAGTPRRTLRSTRLSHRAARGRPVAASGARRADESLDRVAREMRPRLRSARDAVTQGLDRLELAGDEPQLAHELVRTEVIDQHVDGHFLFARERIFVAVELETRLANDPRS
jgi:hypothetical protein